MLLRAIRCSMASSATAQASWWRPFTALLAGDAQARCSSRSNTSHTQEIVVSRFDHLGGEIAAHAIGRRAFARHHRQPARLRLVVEVLHQLGELRGRRAVDRFEGDGGAARLRGMQARLAVGVAAGERQRAGDGQQRPTIRRLAARERARTRTPRHGRPCRTRFCSLIPRSGRTVAAIRLACPASRARRGSVSRSSAMALMWRP